MLNCMANMQIVFIHVYLKMNVFQKQCNIQYFNYTILINLDPLVTGSFIPVKTAGFKFAPKTAGWL